VAATSLLVRHGANSIGALEYLWVNSFLLVVKTTSSDISILLTRILRNDDKQPSNHDGQQWQHHIL
jgi:hypothetical protein